MLHENRRLHNHHELLARQGRDNDLGGPLPGFSRLIPSFLNPTHSKPPGPRTSRITKHSTAHTTPEPVVPASTSVITGDSTSILLPPTTLPQSIPSTPSTPTPTTSLITPGQTQPPSTPVTTTLTVISQIKSSLHPTQSSGAKSAQTSGAVSTGALAGGIGGGIAGAALLGVLVFFLVRRYRKKSLEALTFNASKFRSSAMLLGDPPLPPEKQSFSHKQSPGPRPPSMIERHMTAPAVPPTSASNPYGEHAAYSTDPYAQYTASANQYNAGMYGADGQLARTPYLEAYGGNVSGAAYGQHANYGQGGYGASRTQKEQQHPQGQQHSNKQHNQASISPGQIWPSNANNTHLPNPHTNQPTETGGGPTSINRQPSQTGTIPSTYERDARYVDVQRDVKVAPGTLSVVNGDVEYARGNKNATTGTGASTNKSTRAAASSATQKQRPASSYSSYDPSDAYGGM